MASPPSPDLFGHGPRGRSSWGGYAFLLRFWEAVLRFPSGAKEDTGLADRELDLVSLSIASILLDRLEPEDALGDPLLTRWFRIEEHAFDVESVRRQLLPSAAEAPTRLGELHRLWAWLARRLFRAGCLMPGPLRLIAGELDTRGFRSSPRLEVRAALHAQTGVPLWWAIEPQLEMSALESLLAEPDVGPLVFGKTFPGTRFFNELPFNHAGQAASAFRGLEHTVAGAQSGGGLLFPEDDLAANSAQLETRDSGSRPWLLFASRDEEGLLLGAALAASFDEGRRLPRLVDIAAGSAHFFRLLKNDYAIESLPRWLTASRGELEPASVAVFATTVALAALLEAVFVQAILPDRPMKPETFRTGFLRIPIEVASQRSALEFENALVRQNELAGLVRRRLQAWVR